jgi:hypothetical protein
MDRLKHKRDLKRERDRRYRKNHPEVARRIGARVYKDRRAQIHGPMIYRLLVARQRAARLGVPFDLVAADLVLPLYCPILGIPLQYTPTKKGERDYAPSLDRIRSGDGYVKGNVQVISNRANRWKSDMTLDDIRKLVAYMELHEMIS